MAPPTCINLAMSLARSPVCSPDATSTPKSRPGSVAAARAKLYAQGLGARRSEVSIYKGVSDRPLGWKRRQSVRGATLGRENELSVQRWDGRCRMAGPWDGLRRDQDLWYSNGDCLIHLYAAGTSRRGPAFRIPFECLLRSDCGRLLTKHLSGYSSTASSPSSSSSSDALYFNLPVIPQSGCYDLYIPAPPSLATLNAPMRHHARTRNFFAWVCEKSLVGENLGTALIDLLVTMQGYRSEEADNLEDLKEYMDEMCYNDMSDAPEHAVGMLVFADHIKDDLLWAEAFRHVVGMWDACLECAGYSALSRDTRSLITRAHYSLALRLHHVSTSMATFLDDQLSPAHISLSPQNLTHLARFRDFLHTYWMSVTGYYPPISDHHSSSILGFVSEYNFSKSLLYRMRKQFQALYEYLVNTSFLPHHPSPEAAMGGLCVLQSVQAFDFCGDYTPLMYPLPHLPEQVKIVKQTRSFGNLMGRKDKLYVDPRLAALSTLNKASNDGKPELLRSSLVKAFRLFEKQSVFADAKEKAKKSKKGANQEVEKRKVRWLLVYGIVQTLRMVTEVDDLVKGADGSVDYFLCATVPKVPWVAEESVTSVTQLKSGSASALMHTPSQSSTSTAYTQTSSTNTASTRPPTANSSPVEQHITIEPDIDHVALSRRNSHATSDPAPPMPHPVSMRPSIHRSSLSLSMPSRPHLKLRTQSLPVSTPIQISPASPLKAKGTVKRALSSLGNMPKLQQPKPLRPNSAVEILVGGYGNGMVEVSVGWEGQEERRVLKRRSTSSGESFNDNLEESFYDDRRNEVEVGHCVRSPLSPAYGYEDCLSASWSKTSEEIELGSTSTGTSLSRSGSDSSQEKPVSTKSPDKTPRPRAREARGTDVMCEELGDMRKVYVSVTDVEIAPDSDTDDDSEESELGGKVKRSSMLTLIEALALSAKV